MLKTITVFQKKSTMQNMPPVRFAKIGPNGSTYSIRFPQDCENLNLIPKDLKPFNLVVDSTKVSPSYKSYVDEETGEVRESKILYIRKIEKIEEYIEPETDFDSLR